jgi:hypothetical protein
MKRDTPFHGSNRGLFDGGCVDAAAAPPLCVPRVQCIMLHAEVGASFQTVRVCPQEMLHRCLKKAWGLLEQRVPY